MVSIQALAVQCPSRAFSTGSNDGIMCDKMARLFNMLEYERNLFRGVFAFSHFTFGVNRSLYAFDPAWECRAQFPAVLARTTEELIH